MTPHLRGHVRAYIDRQLPAGLLHIYDQHLVSCAVCREAAEQERRIVSSLRSSATVPAALRSSLLGLQAAPAEAPVPLAPAAVMGTHPSVPTLSPSAPAWHRSPVRAAVIGVVAAGASVVAAVGITAAAPGVASRTTTPVASVPAVGGSTARPVGPVLGPQVLVVRDSSAQSSP